MNIYVGNLPYRTNEQELRGLFEPFGEITSVKLISDRATGRMKGFGFVEMEDDGASKAIESLNDKEFNGRKLVINKAREATDFGNGNGFNNNNRHFR